MKSQYVTSTDAGKYLRVPEQTLRTWRSQGKGPRYRKLPNGKVSYSLADLDAFNAAHTVDPAASSVA